MKRWFYLVALAVYLDSEIALAEQICFNDNVTDISTLFGILAAAMAVLRPVSAALGKISEKTENKWDNKLARFCAKSVSYLGWFVGLFTIGDVPKSVKHKPKLPALKKKTS